MGRPKGSKNKSKIENSIEEISKEDKKYYCVMQLCDKCKNKNGVRKEREFFSTTNTKIFKNGRVHICKDCIKEYCYRKDGSLIIENFKYILMLLDMPFYSKDINSAIEDKKDTIGVYMKNMYLNHCGDNYNSSDKNIQEVVETNSPIGDLLKDFKPTTEMMVKWGFNYKPEQYIKLENFYNQMCETSSIETTGDKDYLKKIAILSMKMDEELENGNYAQAKQLGDLFSKYMADSKFRASDKDDSNKSGIRTFSQLYAEVEKDGFIPPWQKFEKIKGLTQDLVDKTIMHIENFTLRANKMERMVEPPVDTPLIEQEEDIFIGDEND